METQQIIYQANLLVSDCKYGEAQDLLESALKRQPEQPDLCAELGLIYCFGQKEFQAAELLLKSVGTPRHRVLAETLRDYFYCRSQLAEKFQVADEKAAEVRQSIQHLFEGTPEHVGIKLSACLIVKDEEKQLDRCLKSLLPIVDEIVVVDTGSSDRTVEIAKRYGAILGHFDWCDDFAAARNESLRLATGNWALWIDADEELDPEGYDQIREGLIRPQFAGYYFQIINLMEANAEANTYVHTAVRLFRRLPGIQFTGRVHEQIINGFKEQGYVPATLTKAKIIHHGYQAQVMSEKNKIARTISLIEREVADAPDDPFHWFNLANAYSVASNSQEAEAAGKKCIELIKSDAPYGPAAFQILSSALIGLGKPAEALHYCSLADQMGYGTIINEFERSHALFELRRYNEALDSIDKCMVMDWPVDLTGDFGIKTYKGHVLRAQILTALERFEEAEVSVEFALSKHADFGMGLFAKAALFEKLGKWEAAQDLFLRCSSSSGLETCRKFAARMAANAERHRFAADLYREYWQSHPQEVDAWLGWVQACEAIDDFEGALEAYTALDGSDAAATDQRLTHPDLLVNWGRALQLTGNQEGALRKYSDAITMDPGNANAYFNCGDLLYAMGHFEHAAHLYELGLKRRPQFAQGWFVLGNCFARMNMATRAQGSYAHALVLDPEHEQAKQNIEIISKAA